jgi:hypothetical protein
MANRESLYPYLTQVVSELVEELQQHSDRFEAFTKANPNASEERLEQVCYHIRDQLFVHGAVIHAVFELMREYLATGRIDKVLIADAEETAEVFVEDEGAVESCTRP